VASSVAPSVAPARDRACAFVRRGDSVLMVRHRHDGRDYWTLPGGAIESDETTADAAVRELAEETGLDGVAGAVLYRRRYLSGGRAVDETCHRVDVATFAAVLGSDPEDTGSDPMLVAVGWHPLASLREDLQVGLIGGLFPASNPTKEARQ
jgi:8-oxo-dGTP pyrophosphatase MutT (NUDIX family)